MNIEQIFERYGVLQHGHFKLTSGRHSDLYLQKQRVLEHPRVTGELGQALAEHFPEGADVVLAPAVGAIVLGAAVAAALDTRFVFAERVDGAMTLRRGQHIAEGERVIVVEDVITTGGSAAECVRLAEAAGGKVLGVASLFDRSEGALPFPLVALMRVVATSYASEDCPLCVQGLPLDAPGSRSLHG